MSAHMKELHIEMETISIMDKVFLAPKKTAQAILTLVLADPLVKEKSIPYEEMVKEKIKKIGRGAMSLRGARVRDNVTQKELAKKLRIDQSIISKMENGQENITPEIAKKLAKIFNTSYKVFLL